MMNIFFLILREYIDEVFFSSVSLSSIDTPTHHMVHISLNHDFSPLTPTLLSVFEFQ